MKCSHTKRKDKEIVWRMKNFFLGGWGRGGIESKPVQGKMLNRNWEAENKNMCKQKKTDIYKLQLKQET